MNERITLVSRFNETEFVKLDDMLSKIDEKLCKVPYGRNVERFFVDTLPLHFTLCSWDIKEKEDIINKLSEISFKKLNILVDGIDIMDGKENSYVLYFNIKSNPELTKIQKDIYDVLPTKKYNPETFDFHITIHIDKDFNKIMQFKELLEKNFKPFELIVDAFGLYSIYPANLIKLFLV